MTTAKHAPNIFRDIYKLRPFTIYDGIVSFFLTGHI